MGIFLKLNKSVYSNCKSYVYKSGGNSLLDNIFDAYWNLCVKLVPKSITANFLTLLGFLCSTVAFFLMYIFDVSNKKYDCVFIYIGVFLFLYATFDALDGKHARRTNTSSPLGQLFDHGCDAITTTLFVFIIGRVADMQKGLLFFVLMSIWIEHYTKVYNTSLGTIGITEGTVFVITCCIIRGIKGMGFFQKTTVKDLLPATMHALFGKAVLNIAIVNILIILVFFFLMLSVARSSYLGVQTAKKKKKEATLQLSVVYLFLFVQYYFYQSTKNELLCYTIIALYSAFYTLHMNLSTILKIKMDYFPIPVIFYYIVITFLFIKRKTNHHLFKLPVFNENYILYYLLAFGIIYLFDYSHTVITNICKELNITFMFSKKKKR
ncbi:choline/ethanolaminephosphotransferase, putative (CEPT) [Plasmodium ovale curtisi]|uniref:Choline/ethanolaminephosphotransferase, putative (CEPT) n=1 Tax=Plasmodium ovale curtisi TaxID=864141 RepID=A0A1A8W0K1_PLAOA|nr:choline/ethanolaminephosphotransferase, putative (CEPT) [Plasmodium ovale curtisi]SBS94056.1 choline/ethanolaminephosphotransferase, putative (CEPT) [Plasmodium ovale curtisi]